jgi:hypothetical protein
MMQHAAMSARWSRVLLCGLGGMLFLTNLAARELPVFFADNHAETFGWISR